MPSIPTCKICKQEMLVVITRSGHTFKCPTCD